MTYQACQHVSQRPDQAKGAEGVIGFALVMITPQMGLTPLQEGLVGSSALFGLFLGSLVLGWISDHIGRQKIFNFSSAQQSN